MLLKPYPIVRYSNEAVNEVAKLLLSYMKKILLLLAEKIQSLLHILTIDFTFFTCVILKPELDFECFRRLSMYNTDTDLWIMLHFADKAILGIPVEANRELHRILDIGLESLQPAYLLL